LKNSVNCWEAQAPWLCAKVGDQQPSQGVILGRFND